MVSLPFNQFLQPHAMARLPVLTPAKELRPACSFCISAVTSASAAANASSTLFSPFQMVW